jgi:hypothetical protein
MSDGFLGRWARRKEAVRKGEEVPAEPPVVVREAPPPQPSGASGKGSAEEDGVVPEPPPPTLADAQALTPASDFTRFVRPGVAPEVKNAALKKLFADPHFNVMDRLDTYIDDYNTPDPMPPEMLRQLASAKFLKLFDDDGEKEEPKAPTDGATGDDPAPETVAQSGSRTEQALPPADDHADPDLRLQPDDAPGPTGPGAGSR